VIGVVMSMKKYKMPYGHKHLEILLDEQRVSAVLEAKNTESLQNEEIIVRTSLKNPIDSPRLSDLSKNSRKVLLITSDHTRPMPSKITIPLILQEIRQGNKNAEITILIATGCHRATSKIEMIEKFGENVVNNENIINHDCSNLSQLTFKGYLPSGGELWLNSLVDWADLIIAEGFIEPHFFAGFSGGRKSILPGIAGKKNSTIQSLL